jgi:hypothetical protein
MKNEKFEELNKLYFNVESFYYNANKDKSEKTSVTTIIDKFSKVGENDSNKEEEFTSKYTTLDEKAQKLINMVEEIKKEEEIIRNDTQEITFKGIKDYKSINEVQKENNAEKFNRMGASKFVKNDEDVRDDEEYDEEKTVNEDENSEVKEEIEETEEMKLRKELALQIEKLQELEKQNIGLNNKVKQLENEKDKILIKSNERLLEEKDRELSRLKGVYNSSIDMLDFLKDMKNYFKVNQSVKENNEKIIEDLRELQKVISSKDEEIKVLKDFYNTFKSLEIEVED